MIGRLLRRLSIAGLAVVTVSLLFDLLTPINAPVGGGGGPLPGTKRLAIGVKKQGAESRDRLWAGIDKLQKRLFVFSPWVARAEVSPRELHPVDWAALPVIEDCAKLEARGSAPVRSEAGVDARVAWLASALGSFELRAGYTIGLRRDRFLMHPGGFLCGSDWTVGVRDDATGEMLEGERIARAFALRPGDLPILGQVLYGRPDHVSSFQKEYQRVARAPVCVHPSGYGAKNLPCNEFAPRALPRIDDGALTRSLLGTIVLHRLTSEAGNLKPTLTYRRLYIRNGSLQMIEDPIYELETGVVS